MPIAGATSGQATHTAVVAGPTIPLDKRLQAIEADVRNLKSAMIVIGEAAEEVLLEQAQSTEK